MRQPRVPARKPSPEKRSALDPAPAPARRAYARPALTVEGDVRELTLGGSAGLNDSGSPLTQKIPGT